MSVDRARVRMLESLLTEARAVAKLSPWLPDGWVNALDVLEYEAAESAGLILRPDTQEDRHRMT